MAPLPRTTVRDALSVSLTVGAYGAGFGAAELPLLALYLHGGQPVRGHRGRGVRRSCCQRDRDRGDAGHAQRALRNSDGAVVARTWTQARRLDAPHDR